MKEDVVVHTSGTDNTATPAAGKTLTKKFNFWTALGISLCASGAWEGWIASIAQGISAGGPVALFWGWIFVSLGITFVALSLAELASTWPHAGGQYVWVAHLSPKRFRRALSWFNAWFSIAGLWLGAISCAMGVGVQLQAYVMIARPNYEPQRWHVFLITLATILCWVVVNIFFVKALHHMNSAIIYIHVIFYFVNMIVLLACTKNKQSGDYVFTHFENQTGWGNDGVTWCIGLLSALYAFFSLDTTAHFSEEIENPAVMVPRAMILQAVLNGVMTIPFIITVLFCIGDVTELIGSPIYGLSPYTQIVLNSTGKVGAAILLGTSSTVIAFGAGFDLWGAAARSLWSLGRDGALPPLFQRIHPKLGVPVECTLIMVPVAIPILMIYIWNSTAFFGVMAGVLVAFQLSYAMPIGLHAFYGRKKGGYIKGPVNLGRAGWYVDILAFCFTVFMITFMSFPVYLPVSGENMNYAALIIGFVFIFATILWFTYAKSRYVSPDMGVIDGERMVDAPESTDGEKEHDNMGEKVA